MVALLHTQLWVLCLFRVSTLWLAGMNAATPVGAWPASAAAREITERPHAPSGVAAFMSAHSKTPYITPSMDFSSGKGVVRGRRGQQLEFALAWKRIQTWMPSAVPFIWGGEDATSGVLLITVCGSDVDATSGVLLITVCGSDVDATSGVLLITVCGSDVDATSGVLLITVCGSQAITASAASHHPTTASATSRAHRTLVTGLARRHRAVPRARTWQGTTTTSRTRATLSAASTFLRHIQLSCSAHGCIG